MSYLNFPCNQRKNLIFSIKSGKNESRILHIDHRPITFSSRYRWKAQCLTIIFSSKIARKSFSKFPSLSQSHGPYIKDKSFSLVKIRVIILILRICGHGLTKIPGNTYIFYECHRWRRGNGREKNGKLWSV
jgi:hypothetical protein